MIRETKLSPLSGALMLFVLVALMAGAVLLFVHPGASALNPIAATAIFASVALIGLTVVTPNEGRVLPTFGSYAGTVREAGFWWVNPFASKRQISLRARRFESAKLKVNDLDGSPIEIAAIIVWRVADTAEACFNVDNFERYVAVQAEAALRSMASQYPYDAHEATGLSLRGSMTEVAAKLKLEVETSLQKAGVEVIEARISHLAYAPEIAQAMLQRQQAAAIIAARQRIVLEADNVVLLVVLCGERGTQPIINAGALYSG